MAKRSKKVNKPKVEPFTQGNLEDRRLKSHPAMHNAMAVNGLTDAVMGFNPGGMGTQLSQLDTLFVNERWYLVSNNRALLSQAYVEHGLIQALVDVPVDDAFRGELTLTTKQLSSDQVKTLKTTIDGECLASEVIGRARKWSRLYGGGGALIMTDQDPATPLNIAAIRPDSPLEFKAIDMWEMFYSLQNMEGFDGALTNPKFEFYDYYGMKVHKSRIRRMRGLEAPSFIRPRLRGWGFSVVESLVQSVNQFLKSKNVTFEVLDEFKLDVFGFDGLSATLTSADGTRRVQERAQLASVQKNYQNAIILDAKDKYEQKQLTFAGVAEIMKEFRIQIASDMRMPMTKLFGISSSGFNSGEDDIENYNAMVEGQVRAPSKPDLLFLIKLRCQQLFGMVPSDLSVEYKPLRILSSLDEENVKNARFNRLVVALDKGACTIKEFKEGLNKDNLLPIQVDMSMEALPAGESDGASDEEANLDTQTEDEARDEEDPTRKELQ